VPDADEDIGPSARPFWSGTISFGLVSVPVDLVPANRSTRAALRMLSPSGTPLSRRYVAARGDRPLDDDDIVRGFAIEKDRFVVADDDELERLAPDRTRDIDLRVFVKASEIDPMHFERAYYLLPSGESTKAYRLLARAMEESDRSGIATFVMRGKEYLVAILADKGILRAETLRFADEVRTPESMGLPEPRKPDRKEVDRMARAIARLAKPRLDTADLDDRATRRLLELAKKKARSGTDVVHFDPELAEETTDVTDLIALLQRSMSSGGNEPAATGKGTGKGKRKGRGSAKERRSRDDLYAEAKKLDIPGRSQMSREQLAAAIRRRA
jgi:DNA end-binding protein Ku